MKNLTIKLPLVDGSELPLDYENGKELIEAVCGDDFAAPPRSLVIEVQIEDKKIITINIPYDEKANEAFVSIQDDR